MIDELHKVENYKKALVASDPGSGKTWHYDIQVAPKDFMNQSRVIHGKQ